MEGMVLPAAAGPSIRTEESRSHLIHAQTATQPLTNKIELCYVIFNIYLLRVKKFRIIAG